MPVFEVYTPLSEFSDFEIATALLELADLIDMVSVLPAIAGALHTNIGAKDKLKIALKEEAAKRFVLNMMR